MAISNSIGQNEHDKFVESSSVAGQAAIAVVSPDGSDVAVGDTSGDVAHDAVDSGNPVKVGGYAADPTSLPSAVAAADRVNAIHSLQGEYLTYKTRLDAGEDTGNDTQGVTLKTLATSDYAPSLFQDFGSNATAVVKSSAGNVAAIACHNENASDRYIQIHNLSSVPTGGEEPELSFLVATGTQTIIGHDVLQQAGTHMDTGISFAFSTTKDTYTAGTAADQTTFVWYK